MFHVISEHEVRSTFTLVLAIACVMNSQIVTTENKKTMDIILNNPLNTKV